MFRNTFLKIAIGAFVAIAVLSVLRFKPWQGSQSQQAGNETSARAQLNVGFLPVT